MRKILLFVVLVSACFLHSRKENFAAAEEITVSLLPGPGPLDNPLKGWAPYSNNPNIEQPYSMFYSYVNWNDVEPKQGEYSFEDWEKTWEQKQNRGKHVIFRLYIDYPTPFGKPMKKTGLPEWLIKAGVPMKKYSRKGIGYGLSPDYDHPLMIRAMEKLIAELGRRYNKNPRVAFLQLGLLGHWGEWHTFANPKLFASYETQKRVIDAYRKAFPNKILMARNPKDYAGKQSWLGFHDDYFPDDTDNGHDWSFLAQMRTSGSDSNWKRAIVGGEMIPGKAKFYMGKEFDLTLKMLKRAHFSWIGPYGPASERDVTPQYLERCQQLVRTMGYEFQWNQLKHPKTIQSSQEFSISLSGKNKGIAPFYYPWSVEFALLDASGKVVANQKTNWDIRKWLPGSIQEKVNLKFEITPGTYQIALGVRDPWKKQPSVRFANKLKVVEGWTVLSKIIVDP